MRQNVNVKVKVTQNGMHYSVIPRGIHTPNLGFLPQIIYRLYAPDPIILETGSYIGHSDLKWSATYHHPKMHTYTKFIWDSNLK